MPDYRECLPWYVGDDTSETVGIVYCLCPCSRCPSLSYHQGFLLERLEMIVMIYTPTLVGSWCSNRQTAMVLQLKLFGFGSRKTAEVVLLLTFINRLRIICLSVYFGLDGKNTNTLIIYALMLIGITSSR